MQLSVTERERLYAILEKYDQNPKVQQMREFIQHGDVTTYQHCKNVVLVSFWINRRFHLGADETALREPTGRARSGSDSAEPGRQVCRFGGAGENISGTVRGAAAVALSAYGNIAAGKGPALKMSVESVSTDFFCRRDQKRQANQTQGGYNYEAQWSDWFHRRPHHSLPRGRLRQFPQAG